MTERKRIEVKGWTNDDGLELMQMGLVPAARKIKLDDWRHPVTIIYEPPESRYGVQRGPAGMWEILDRQEKRLLGTKYTADHPGGPQAAAEAEAKVLNEMEESK